MAEPARCKIDYFYVKISLKVNRWNFSSRPKALMEDFKFKETGLRCEPHPWRYSETWPFGGLE